MNRHTVEVVEQARLYGDTHVLWMRQPWPDDAWHDGQFAMCYVGEGDDPLLGRPMSIHRTRPSADGAEFAILFEVTGVGSEWLARRRGGESADLGRTGGALGRGSLGGDLLGAGRGDLGFLRLDRHGSPPIFRVHPNSGRYPDPLRLCP